ncbi:MAG: hypothetical protein PUA56_03230 [Bacillales bacterium]|nr:hypothetical protein [Bacillales bacterium]
MKKIFLILPLIASSLFLGGCTSNNQNNGYEEISVNKKITDLSKNSCPSTGKIKALVVPIHFSDDTNMFNDVEIIKAAFNNSSSSITPEWKSIKEFYFTSSYGQLEFDFEITEVFTPSNPSTYYSDTTNPNVDSYNVNASRSIYSDVLNHFDSQYDYNDYDYDKDGFIDCIYLIYDHPVDYSYKNQLWWAYTAEGSKENKYDNCQMGKYVWCGYDFFLKDGLKCNTQTLIHETGHLFGLDDYYDYSTSVGTSKGGLAGADLMDNDNGSPCGDHNSYTKTLLGWCKPKLITTTTSVTLSLSPLQDKGDLIVLAKDYDKDLNIYQELFILEYYTPTKLQERDKPFSISGIRMLHVNAQLDSKGHFKYNNTNTQQKFISQITTKNGDTYLTNNSKRSDSTLFIENEKLETVLTINDERLPYVFSVDILTSSSATITISYI